MSKKKGTTPKKETVTPRKWTDQEFTWYHRAEGFDRVAWWAETKADGSRTRDSIDEDNPLLWAKSAKEDPRLKKEPLLWEILRRHPDVGVLRAKYNFVSHICNQRSDEVADPDPDPEAWFVEHAEALKELYSLRAYNLIHYLFQKGLYSWSNLSETDRAFFKVRLRLYLNDKESLPLGKRIDLGSGILDGLMWEQYLEMGLGDMSGKNHEKGSIGELRGSTEACGCKLVVLVVDPTTPEDELKELIIEESMLQITGERMAFGYDKGKEGHKLKETFVSVNDDNPNSIKITTIPHEDSMLHAFEDRQIFGFVKDEGKQKRERNTMNISSGKYITLADLDRADGIGAELRKKLNRLFADFSLLGRVSEEVN